jgi:type I restriction enzyme, S subunit
MPLRAVADYVVSNVDKVPADDELPVRLCNYSDVYNNEFIDLRLDFMRCTATEDEISKFHLEVGDVLITKDSESWDDIGVPALVTMTDDDLVCGYHLALLRPRPERLLGRFLLRCLQAKILRLQLELAANGVTRFGLPKSDIGAMRLPIPPIKTQQSIAEALDKEAGRIDALISAKQNVLRLLSHKRTALIASAITKGLDTTVKMCNSDVPWLGKIPSHWKMERARWLFRERDERSETGNEELLTVSHITGVTPRSEKDVNMFEAETNEGYKICFPGDLVINTLWAWMGAMGVATVKGIVSPAYHVYEPRQELEPAYIDALVRLPVFAQEVTRYSKGVWSSRLRLYPEGFFETYLPVPPLSEQRAIINHIANEIAKLDALRSAAEKTIDLLKERRATIIEAMVMGQITLESAA